MSKKRLNGKVVSNRMSKTVVVAVEHFRRHGLYEKVMKSTKKYKAESLESLPLGLMVTIEQTRPLSREKCWRVVTGPDLVAKETKKK